MQSANTSNKVHSACTKLAIEPARGLREGLLQCYSAAVSQETLARVDDVQWRQLLYALCFMHAVLQVRHEV